jgi:hypothetical protein
MSDLEKLKVHFAKAVFGKDRRDDQCVMCGKAVNPETDFKDTLSKKEFTISHFCQVCQDDTFKEEY